MREVIDFSFAGVTEDHGVAFAVVKLNMGFNADSIGFTNVTISVPIADPSQTLAQLRERSLSLARESIQTGPLLAWMAAQREFVVLE